MFSAHGENALVNRMGMGILSGVKVDEESNRSGQKTLSYAANRC